jgi:hypothetical protein
VLFTIAALLFQIEKDNDAKASERESSEIAFETMDGTRFTIRKSSNKRLLSGLTKQLAKGMENPYTDAKVQENDSRQDEAKKSVEMDEEPTVDNSFLDLAKARIKDSVQIWSSEFNGSSYKGKLGFKLVKIKLKRIDLTIKPFNPYLGEDGSFDGPIPDEYQLHEILIERSFNGVDIFKDGEKNTVDLRVPAKIYYSDGSKLKRIVGNASIKLTSNTAKQQITGTVLISTKNASEVKTTEPLYFKKKKGKAPAVLFKAKFTAEAESESQVS